MEGLTALWTSAYKSIDVDPTSRRLMISMAPQAPISFREKIVETAFEQMNVPSFFASTNYFLASYAAGRTTLTQIMIDELETIIGFLYEGVEVPVGLNVVPIGAQTVANHLKELLSRDAGNLSREDASALLEHCFVAPRFEAATQTLEERIDLETSVTLKSDGRTIFLKDERFWAPEVLFQPSMLKIDIDGLSWRIHDAIMRTAIDLRTDFVRNMLIGGRLGSLPGIKERLTHDMRRINPLLYESIRFVDHPKNAVWVGESILASLESFEDRWLTRAYYDEYGSKGAARLFL